MFFEQLERSLQAFDASRYTNHISLDNNQLKPREAPQYQAAVLLLITDEPEPHLIYAKRAEHLNNHAGEICFPGGMWEAEDISLAHTALRETEEELGVRIEAHQLIGVLPARATRKGVQVLPLVARVSPDAEFLPNPQELSEVFRVPVFALNQLKVRVDRFERAGLVYKIPVYAWGNHEIWGFTAALTEDLLKLIQAISVETE